MTLLKKDFPKAFAGGCIGSACTQGCGALRLEEQGGVSAQDGCDGAGGSGKWKRQGQSVVIEYAMGSLTPEDLCSYRDGTPECIRQIEQENKKKCGDKTGCSTKYRRVITMSGDNQFVLDGQPTCVYPSD